MHRRQTVKIVAPERTGIRMVRWRRGEVHFIAAQQRVPGNHIVSAVADVARHAGGGVEHGINQNQLRGLPRRIRFQAQGRYQSEVPAGAVASQCDA